MIGTVLGNYQITEKLGEGGMGAVYKGIDLMLEREVAIKALRPEFSRQPQLVERFRAEAVTLAKLNHPNIATLHSFFRQGDDFFMVMEFVRGETLDSVIRNSGAMAIERATSLFCHALEGIGHAHNMGIVHRDIKPANMMLTETGSIKVMDFGIARVLGTARMTKQGMVVGTIEYMSPEQVQGLDTDARSDIYSLGILLYEMLTGRVPFHSDNEFKLMKAQIEEAPVPPRVHAPHIPLSVEQAIMRSLAKKPEARYQTVAEFRAVLESSLTGAARPAETRPPVAAPPETRIAPAVVTSPDAAAMNTADMPSAATGANQPRETRLGAPAAVQPQYNQGAYVQPAYAQPPAAQARPSLASRLTLFHYAGAAVLLAALVGVPLALMASGGGDQPAPQPNAAQPAAQQPAPAPPAAAQPVAPAQTQPAVQQSGPPAVLQPVEAKDAPATGQKPGAGDSASKQTRTGRKASSDAAERERQRKGVAALKALDN
jgi:tRNA A-37 threonylcarbamoyl transferase component Bud32